MPDEIKEQMESHPEINWSAVLRQHIEAELMKFEHQNVANAVATSERLSQQIDEDEVAEENTADVIRDFRDTRYGEESA
ncbi:MAG: hypothetical protein V5A27_02805 [Halapricum sp.]